MNKTYAMFLSGLFVATVAVAQQAQPQRVQPKANEARGSVDPARADIAIIATIRADELEFEIVPNIRVEFFVTPDSKVEWTSDRQNLPEKVQPKVIYRDIGLQLKIVSILPDIEQIVDEALGPTQPQTERP